MRRPHPTHTGTIYKKFCVPAFRAPPNFKTYFFPNSSTLPLCSSVVLPRSLALPSRSSSLPPRPSLLRESPPPPPRASASLPGRHRLLRVSACIASSASLHLKVQILPIFYLDYWAVVAGICCWFGLLSVGCWYICCCLDYWVWPNLMHENKLID